MKKLDQLPKMKKLVVSGGQTPSISVPEIQHLPTETIFWVSFENGKHMSDRMQVFNERKTAKDFFYWIENKRKELEDLSGEKYTMTNCGIIR